MRTKAGCLTPTTKSRTADATPSHRQLKPHLPIQLLTNARRRRSLPSTAQQSLTPDQRIVQYSSEYWESVADRGAEAFQNDPTTVGSRLEFARFLIFSVGCAKLDGGIDLQWHVMRYDTLITHFEPEELYPQCAKHNAVRCGQLLKSPELSIDRTGPRSNN